MAKMRIYTVHINPKKKQPYTIPVFVEEAVNWYAFIVPGIWALYHRLWLVFAAVVAVNLLLGGLANAEIISPFSLGVIQLGFHFFMALEGNNWRRSKLKAQGYVTSDVVTADGELAAEQRFFERHFPLHAPLPVLER